MPLSHDADNQAKFNRWIVPFLMGQPYASTHYIWMELPMTVKCASEAMLRKLLARAVAGNQPIAKCTNTNTDKGIRRGAPVYWRFTGEDKKSKTGGTDA